MASSRSTSSASPDQEPHVEPLLIPPSPSHVPTSNPAHRDSYRIPRRPVGSYSSVAVDEQVDQHTIPRKPVGGSSSVTVHDSDEQVGEGACNSIPPNEHLLLEWRPIYLRRQVVISFAILFILLIAAIAILYQLSQRWHGLVSAEQRLKYLWTYGPTAVFTIVAAFWSRLEYQAKQSAPWSAMIRGPSKASDSILLDYVSPLKPTALLAAIRNKQYLVSSGILGSLMFTLIIIFSTSLMSLTSVDILRNDVSVATFNAFTGNKTALEEVGSLPWNILRGINYENLSFPLGTNEQFAVQTFDAIGVPEGSVIEATVDGFSAYLVCEEADLVVGYWYQQNLYDDDDYDIDPTWESNLTAVTPSCTVSNVELTLTSANLPYNSTQSWVHFQTGVCDGISGNAGRRVLVSAGDLRLGPEVITVIVSNMTGGENLTDHTGNFTVLHSANLLCQPVYWMSQVIATTNSTDTASKAQFQTVLAPSNTNWTLDGVDAWDIFDAQNTAANQNVVAEDLLIQPYSNVSIDRQMIQGLRLYGDSAPVLEDLFQADVVGAVANRYFSTIAAQIASRCLLKERTAFLTGSAVVSENRLFVGILATTVIEAALAVVLVLSLAMLLFIPKRALAARDPGSIFGLATILRNSPTLVSILHRTGSLDIQKLHEKLDGWAFDSSLHSRPLFGVYAEDHRLVDDAQKHTPGHSIDGKLPTWEPFFVTWVGRAVLCVFTIAIIVALEVLLHVSQRHTGFGDASNGGYLHYVWRYIPVVLLVILGLLYTALDFATQCLAPYSRLKADTTFDKSLMVNFLDRLPPIAIYESIRYGQWAVAATTIAALLSSFLAIVGSGLFGPVSVPLTWPVQLQQQSYFTSNNGDVANKYNTETYGEDVEGLVLYGNMSDPDWTYEALALTSLGFSFQDQSIINDMLTSGSASINVMIPALRSNLTCRVESQPTNLNITLEFNGSTPDEFGNPYQNPLIVTANDETCSGCPYPCDTFEYQTPFYWNAKPDLYFARASDDLDHDATCSDFTFAWGKLNINSIQHIGYIGCNESVETVLVNTTLLYPSLSFDPEHPPTPDESTATPSPAIIPPLEYNQAGGYLPNVTFGAGTGLDNFWDAVVWGLNGIPLDYLSNPANDQDVIDRIKQLHKLIRAQQFNNYTRIFSNNASQVGAPIRANITDPNRLRVVQDAASTRILEGLLAAMLLCVVFAGVLMDTRKVIPKNPCSIAAVGSFLADSNLMAVLPEFEEAEGMIADEGEMAKRLGLRDKGVVFRMGWIGDEREGGAGKDRVYGIQMARLEAGRESGKIKEEAKLLVLSSTTPEAEGESILS